MYVHINDLYPVLKDMLKSDVSDKIPLTADPLNPFRVFAVSCFSNTYLNGYLSAIPNKNGFIKIPNHDEALTALKEAGGILPFNLNLPMGLNFSIKLNKADFDKFYSLIKEKGLDELPSETEEQA